MDITEIINQLIVIQGFSPEYNSCYYKNECNKYPNCTPIKEIRKKVKKATGQDFFEPCIYKLLDDLIKGIINENGN